MSASEGENCKNNGSLQWMVLLILANDHDEEHLTYCGGILIAVDKSSVIFEVENCCCDGENRHSCHNIIALNIRKKWPPTTHLHDENELPLVQP